MANDRTRAWPLFSAVSLARNEHVLYRPPYIPNSLKETFDDSRWLQSIITSENFPSERNISPIWLSAFTTVLVETLRSFLFVPHATHHVGVTELLTRQRRRGISISLLSLLPGPIADYSLAPSSFQEPLSCTSLRLQCLTLYQPPLPPPSPSLTSIRSRAFQSTHLQLSHLDWNYRNFR